MAFFIPSSILDLSDDVLLLIFSSVRPWDLLNLSKTCRRFSKVASDKSLWSDADLSDGCLSLQQVRRCLMFLRPNTRRVVLRGYKNKYARTPNWKTPLISPSLLKAIGDKCPNLEEFTLKEAFVNATKVKMTDFAPISSISKLSLIDCEFMNLPSLSNDASYFKWLHKTLPRLEVLEMIKCGWVDDYDVMVLSKADLIRRLVLRNLPRVGQAMVYIALGFRFGFQNLEELDLRGTSLEDNEVYSVVQNNKLKALYLGPLGPVKRPQKGPLAHHNLIMPDPRQRQELQQVVVINVGPNGPQWRQVNDEELDDMGLEWVRNAQAAQRRRDREMDYDRHYFIDKDGRPIREEQEDNGSKAFQDRSGKRRQLSHQGEPSAKQSRGAYRQQHQQQKQQQGHSHEDSSSSSPPPPQQSHSDDRQDYKDAKGEEEEKEEKEEQGDDDDDDNDDEGDDDDNDDGDDDNDDDGEEEDEDEEEEDFGPYSGNEEEEQLNDSNLGEASPGPDECLTDKLIPAFGQKTKHLETLVLSGCSITDQGLLDIIRLVPSLKLLDMTNTRVTNAGLQQARLAQPDCVILGGNTIQLSSTR